MGEGQVTPRNLLIVSGLVVAALLGWGYQSAKRAGALEVLLQQTDSAAKVAAVRGDSLERVFKHDTVRLVKRLTTTDTLLQTKIDSAIVHHTDTLTITVKEAAAIDTTIKACRAVVLTCGQLNDQRKAQIEALNAEVALLRKQQSSTFGNVVRGAGVLAVGYLIGHISR